MRASHIPGADGHAYFIIVKSFPEIALDVLGHAAREGRLLATHDFHDMPQHFAAFIQEQTSAGVLLVPQRLPVAAVVEDLMLIWAATEAEDWHNCITSLAL